MGGAVLFERKRGKAGLRPGRVPNRASSSCAIEAEPPASSSAARNASTCADSIGPAALILTLASVSSRAVGCSTMLTRWSSPRSRIRLGSSQKTVAGAPE